MSTPSTAASNAIDEALRQPAEAQEKGMARWREINSELGKLLKKFTASDIAKAILYGDHDDELTEALEDEGFVDSMNYDLDEETEVEAAFAEALSCLRRGAKDDTRHHLYTRICEPFRDLFHHDSGI